MLILQVKAKMCKKCLKTQMEKTSNSNQAFEGWQLQILYLKNITSKTQVIVVLVTILCKKIKIKKDNGKLRYFHIPQLWNYTSLCGFISDFLISYGLKFDLDVLLFFYYLILFSFLF